MQAAAQLLSRRGYAATSTNQIAARAGVSIGSVYEYFRDKGAIVDALLDEHLSWGEQLIETRALELVKNAGERPLRAVLAEMVGVMLELHAEEPKLHRVLSSEAARAGAAPRVTALEERATTLIGALLSSHPDVRVADVSLAARVVVQIIDALTHRWIIEPAGEPVPLHKLSRELTAVLTSYLSAPS